MIKTFKKLVAIMMMILFVFMYYTSAQAAGLLSSASVSLTEPRATQQSQYDFAVTTATTANVKGIKIKWRMTASSGDSMPSSMSLAGAALASITGVNDSGNWTLDATDVATGIIYLVNGAAAQTAAATAVTFGISGVTNPSIAANPVGCAPNPTNSSSGTCFNRIMTFDTATIATMQAETAGNIVDQATIGFTVNAGVSVTAKVDPALTFTVAGVASGAAANGVNTSATSDYNLLPFGYLSVNTPKYLAQDIYIKTNANNGYSVTAKMASQMTSVYGNDIDPFYGAHASHITWGTPAAWASPDGTTANDDTGWLGMNTSNGSNIAGWGTPTGIWGPLQSSQANTVRHSLTPDLGTSATRITFAIESNVYQPADSYTGILVYNCVPIY